MISCALDLSQISQIGQSHKLWANKVLHRSLIFCKWLSRAFGAGAWARAGIVLFEPLGGESFKPAVNDWSMVTEAMLVEQCFLMSEVMSLEAIYVSAVGLEVPGRKLLILHNWWLSTAVLWAFSFQAYSDSLSCMTILSLIMLHAVALHKRAAPLCFVVAAGIQVCPHPTASNNVFLSGKISLLCCHFVESKFTVQTVPMQGSWRFQHLSSSCHSRQVIACFNRLLLNNIWIKVQSQRLWQRILTRKPRHSSAIVKISHVLSGWGEILSQVKT